MVSSSSSDPYQERTLPAELDLETLEWVDRLHGTWPADSIGSYHDAFDLLIAFARKHLTEVPE